jgi:hypothetical protein
MVKHAEVLARFSHDFGAPFLLGQRSVVGSPLGKDGLLAIKNGLGIDTALSEACERQLEQAGHFVDLTPAPFDEDAGALLYAIHDLFACTHPQASSFYARAHLFCRAAAQEVSSLPRTLEPRRLLTRHLLVERAFLTTRTDVYVRWWTGSAAFFGEEAPRRLTAWPSMRRVNVDRRTTPMWKLALSAGDEELRVARAALLVSLLDASPLTRLTLLGDPAQKALGFSLILPYKIGGKKVSPLDALEDKHLARGVIDRLLERGMDVTGPPLALTLLQSLREGVSPRILRRAAEVCVHLVIAACIVEGDAAGAKETKTLRSFLNDDPAQMNEALRVFWAVVSAAVDLDGVAFFLPDPADLPRRSASLWARVKERLGHKRVLAVAEPLKRELQRRLPPPNEAPRPDAADDPAVEDEARA